MLVKTRLAGAARTYVPYAPRTELTANHRVLRSDEETRAPPDGGAFFISAHAEVIENPARRFTAFKHRGHDQIGSAHHVTAGEHLAVGGLERCRGAGGHAHPAAFVHADVMIAKPGGRTRQEAERDNDRIRRHDALGAGHRLGRAPAARVRFP